MAFFTYRGSVPVEGHESSNLRLGAPKLRGERAAAAKASRYFARFHCRNRPNPLNKI
jgi:hypothetical protein